MKNAELTKTIKNFAKITTQIPDAQLDSAWAWKSYDSEGIRFAFFRTYEELRELATKLRNDRMAQDLPVSVAQLILAQYEAAYWDLQGALIGVEDEKIDQAPSEGEWPIRNILAHMIGAELGFYVVVSHGLDRHRRGENPSEITKEIWSEVSGMDQASFGAIMTGSFEGLQDYHNTLHERVLQELAEIRDEELEIPSKYWEKELMSIRFRLHRFDSHLRQHTIQIDKTRVAVGQIPTEAQRLMRLIYSGLADVSGAIIGAWEMGKNSRLELAKQIKMRAEEIVSQ